jgi:hypothetical protein
MDDFDSGGGVKAGADAGDDGATPPLPQTVSAIHLQSSPFI